MSNEEMLAKVDHTLLKPYATWADIRQICEDAIAYHTATVCIPPSYIGRIREAYGDRVKICTVIGFPLGYQVTEVKALEAKKALEDGASEIDMVINIGDAKGGRFDAITEEIRTLKKAVGDHVLKVIIETCYLTEEEKIKLCHCVTEAGADFIKTSTGFGSAGANLEDVKLLRAHVGPQVKVKAAGGIRSIADREDFINAGADRLGTSSAIKLIKGENTSGY